MELILVRHGEPAWSDADGLARNDPVLTDRGRAQARAVARRLAATEQVPEWGDIDRLLVSPAVRAQETAAPIAAALDLPIETSDWLLELHNPPQWEGAPIEQVRVAFESMQHADREVWWNGMPGGESPAAFHERVTAGLDAFLEGLGIRPAPDQPRLWDSDGPIDEEDHDRLVLVAHGGTNSVIVTHLLGLDHEPWDWFRFTMGHASIAQLDTVAIAGHHAWSLRALGDANHLGVPDRTY
ncbi:MAG: histidine phosphatase family protein [Acidimicrobiales bacterium]|nr:histidine phosphatase family protein [Acidimicrobiales bacterium]